MDVPLRNSTKKSRAKFLMKMSENNAFFHTSIEEPKGQIGPNSR